MVVVGRGEGGLNAEGVAGRGTGAGGRAGGAGLGEEGQVARRRGDRAHAALRALVPAACVAGAWRVDSPHSRFSPRELCCVLPRAWTRDAARGSWSCEVCAGVGGPQRPAGDSAHDVKRLMPSLTTKSGWCRPGWVGLSESVTFFRIIAHLRYRLTPLRDRRWPRPKAAVHQAHWRRCTIEDRTSKVHSVRL